MSTSSFEIRSNLKKTLTRTKLAGPVQTSRESNLRSIDRLSIGDPCFTFGLEFDNLRSNQILEIMAKRCGISPDPTYLTGVDHINVDQTIDALDCMATRIRGAIENRSSILLATGHPTGLLAIHLAIARGLGESGVDVVRVPDGIPVDGGDIRQLNGVAMLHNDGCLHHTHQPSCMKLLLERLELQGRRPDLVVADHGWAGYAAQQGIDTVCFADSNDPALFVAEEYGLISTVVPIDDSMPFHLYDPVNAYILLKAGMGG